MDFYDKFIEKNQYDQKTQDCIKNTVSYLLKTCTTIQKPGMLLGKIQSGKTRTFIGITARAFDNGYDLIIILTKGTKALATQTYKRLYSEYKELIEEEEVRIYDIMSVPENLTPYIREKKLIFIVKKQTHNFDRLEKLFSDYKDFESKKNLIIDDEADYASIGFKKSKNGNINNDDIEITVIAKKINNIRAFSEETDFLQVTATPYSLYLQPDKMEQSNGEEYHPVRPAFTELVPIHEKYIGSEYYFEKSDDPFSPAYFLYVAVPEKELTVLAKEDQRYLSGILTTPNLSTFRFAMVNFIVAGAVRRLQEDNPKKFKFSCIIHSETGKKSTIGKII